MTSQLPGKAASMVVRGLGTYIRATKPEELPGNLRRHKGFTPRGLQAHRDALVDALDDAALRARVLEWLDDHPRVPRDVSDALTLACERPEGWTARLAASPAPKPQRAGAPAASDRTERERERARKAREEARRVKEQAKADVDAARTRAVAVTEKLNAMAAELADARRRAAAADRELARVRRELERERRKARAADDQARRDKERIKKELAGARKEIARLSRPSPKASRPAPRPARRPPKERGPRKPLRAPKGRLEEDPETLDEWLGTAGVHLLIDGYNVVMAEGGFGGELADQRSRLIDEVARLVRRKRAQATIVFDGSDVPPGVGRRRRGAVAVEYSRPQETADDHLVALLGALPPDPVIVVTNDKELQARAAALGATIARSTQLLALLR
ncbi:MAG: NYN domain-containing protein [Actinomycetota bacterium]